MIEKIRLNIGGATNPLPGYIVVDHKTGQEAYPLNYPEKSVDEIRASHVLEHFSYQQTDKILKDWVRALKTGGILKIAVPDFEWIARTYVQAEQIERDNQVILNGGLTAYSENLTFNYDTKPSPHIPIESLLMGSQTDQDDFHKAVFTYWKLFTMMCHVGLVDIRRWRGDPEDCSGIPFVSLNLEGRKWR